MWFILVALISNFPLIFGWPNCVSNPRKNVLATRGEFDIEQCGNYELDLGPVEFRDNYTSINAYQNKITEIDGETFRGAYNLLIIDVQKNLLTEIRNSTFSGSPKLTKLLLNMNKIERLEVAAFIGLRNLEELTLTANLLRTLKVGTFDPLQNLRHIDLHYNRISILESGIFLKNRNLREIDLAKNQIFVIGRETMLWDNFEFIYLRENLCTNDDFVRGNSLEIAGFLKAIDRCFNNDNSEKLKEELEQCKKSWEIEKAKNLINSLGLDESNGFFSWKYLSLLFAGLFGISLMIHLIFCMIWKCGKKPPSSSLVRDQSVSSCHQTVMVDRSQGSMFGPISRTHRVVDENFEEMDVDFRADGRVHLYDRPSPRNLNGMNRSH
jgi:hypothetical protein